MVSSSARLERCVHESPFYFESGVNGGWIMEKMPTREVNALCRSRAFAPSGSAWYHAGRFPC